jgi:PAS domain S-box-containing protein
MLPYQVIRTEKIRQYEEELQKLHTVIREAAEFIGEIGNGNLDATYENGEGDTTLRTALLTMKEQLKHLSEQEKNQHWTNEGLAVFSDLLRQPFQTLEAFSDALIAQLVKYLKANQGGIFILNDEQAEEPILELSAAYAYNKKKHIQKRIYPGEGLLGQAYLEKETIYLTEVPDEYVQITSGLGEANPRCILIVPLKHNELLAGVLELASFHTMEPYQIEFVEKVAESIATIVSSLKISHRTEKLLQETKIQAESLRAQEEEMRQNLEELKTTQENNERIEQELRHHKDLLEQKLAEHKEESARMMTYMEGYKKILVEVLDEIPQKVFLKDEEGKFILVNTVVANLHNLSVEEMLGTSDFDHFEKSLAQEFRNREIKIVEEGKPVIFYQEETLSGEQRTLQTMKMPIYLHHLQKPGGLLGIQTDVTEIKRLEARIQEQDAELAELRSLLNR